MQVFPIVDDDVDRCKLEADKCPLGDDVLQSQLRTDL